MNAALARHSHLYSTDILDPRWQVRAAGVVCMFVAKSTELTEFRSLQSKRHLLLTRSCWQKKRNLLLTRSCWHTCDPSSAPLAAAALDALVGSYLRFPTFLALALERQNGPGMQRLLHTRERSARVLVAWLAIRARDSRRTTCLPTSRNYPHSPWEEMLQLLLQL